MALKIPPALDTIKRERGEPITATKAEPAKTKAEKFDRVAYQRDLMRKRRAKAKKS